MIKERIIHLRRLMLVHSYIYYELNSNIVSDHKWQAWADELTKLQKENPNLILKFYDNEFKDWDGSTGMHLPVDPWVIIKANYLISIDKKYKPNTEFN